MRGRRFVAVALSATMCVSMAATTFASSNDGDMSFREFYEEMREKEQPASIEGDATLTFAMAIRDESGDTNLPMRADAEMRFKAQKEGVSAVVGTMSTNMMGQAQEFPVEAYAEVADGSMTTYVKNPETGEWDSSVQEFSIEQVDEAMMEKDSEAMAFFDENVDVKNLGDAYALEIKITQDLIASMTGQDVSEMTGGMDISDVAIIASAEFDKETGYPKRVHAGLDTSDGQASFAVDGAEGLKAYVETASFDMNVEPSNEALDVEIPESVKNGTAGSDVSIDLGGLGEIETEPQTDAPKQEAKSGSMSGEKLEAKSDRWGKTVGFKGYDKLVANEADEDHLYAASEEYEFGYPTVSLYVCDDDFYEEGDGKATIESSRDFDEDFYADGGYSDVEISEVFSGKTSDGYPMYGYSEQYTNDEYGFTYKSYKVAIEMPNGGYLNVIIDADYDVGEDTVLTDDFANGVIDAITFN